MAKEAGMEGVEWRVKYNNAFRRSGCSHFALLEFVKDNSPEQVIKDAETLREIICQ
ncbi:MAG: hypothetical protein WCI51_15340 [Lentisphaerota bacterium]